MAVRMERSDGNGGWRSEVTYEGRVLECRERNYYDDSDFYAVCWDDEKNRVVAVEYATTRGWTYNNSAAVDADDATLEKVLAYKSDEYLARARSAFAQRMERVDRGRTVTLKRTVRSRKNGTFEKGSVGRVFWYGADQYARYRDAYRAGVEFEDGRKHFFSTDDLVGVADETFDADAASEYAAAQARRYVEDVRRMRVRRVAA